MPATIEVKTSVNALHNWPNATKGRSYLAAPHRHKFNISAEARVEHNERDIEFHDFQDMLHVAIYKFCTYSVVNSFGSMSCESIATAILTELPDAVFRVSVFEDEDCGAHVTRDEPARDYVRELLDSE